MANVDRPNGFRLVKTITGAPVSSVIRSVGVTDAADIFVGDALTLTSGLAAVAATNDAAFLGVAVGFGKVNSMTGEIQGMFNATSLETRYYDDSASTHTEWVCFYVPASDGVFEVQTSGAQTLLPGSSCDLVATAGNTTTGQSNHEITSSTNADFKVVEVPKYVDNDHTAAWGRYWVMFTHGEQAFNV